VCLLAAVMVFVGCQEQRKRPKADSLSVTGDLPVTEQAAAALEVTGGLDTWKQTDSIDLSVVAAYYRSDGSSYLTEHVIAIRPWSNAVTVSSKEPLGLCQWDLAGGRFATTEGDRRQDVSGRQVSPRDMAEAVLLLVTAPVRMLDSTARFEQIPDAVKLEGTWYKRLARTWVPDPREKNLISPYWSNVIFYQRRAGGLVDTVLLTGGDDNAMLAVRGFDYIPASRTRAMVPTKMEIYRTDARGDLKERLVQLDVR